MKQFAVQIRQIFAFTFRRQVEKKGYRLTLILVALLCFALPMGILGAMAYGEGNGDGMPAGPGPMPEGDPAVSGTLQTVWPQAAIRDIYVVEASDGATETGEGASGPLTAAALESFDFAGVLGADIGTPTFWGCGGDLSGAMEKTRGRDDGVILLIRDDMATLQLLIPQESGLVPAALTDLQEALTGYVQYVADVTAAHGGEMRPQAGEMDSLSTEEPGDGEDVRLARQVLEYLIPYLNIMVLYSFVLFYGQSVAQSVVMEKSSKLMDLFMLSVQPEALILGKMTAQCLAGVMQIAVWLLALVGGFYGGGLLARAIAPDVQLPVLEILSALGEMGGLVISLPGLLLGICFIIVGMLLYCALAGIGGAIAGKAEELSSTNILFTVILVISFLACLLAGGLSGGGGAAWLDWVPFTSVLLSPAHLLIGSLSVGRGCLCLLVSSATCLLLVWLAGRIYRVMALYQGKIPSVKQILKQTMKLSL